MNPPRPVATAAPVLAGLAAAGLFGYALHLAVSVAGEVVAALIERGWARHVGSPSPALFVAYCLGDPACSPAFAGAWLARYPLWAPAASLTLLVAGALARALGQRAPAPPKAPGAARWASGRELGPLARPGRDKRGYLGLSPSGNLLRPTEEGRCQHALVVGGTGAGKSSGYHKPNLLLDAHDGVSAVVVDLKYPDPRSGFLEVVPFFEGTHDLQVFLPFEEATLRLPLLADVEDPRVAAEVASLVVPPPPRESDGAFYPREARGLLEALLLDMGRRGETSPKRLLRLVLAGSDELARRLETADEEVRLASRLFFALRGDHRSGVLATLRERLALFGDDRLDRAATASSNPRENVDLATLGVRPTLVYLGAPQEELEGPAGQVLLQLVKRAVDRALLRTATANGGRLPVPVSVYLDEFAAMGPLPNVRTNFATMRSRGVSYHVTLQNLAQGEAVYGRDEFRAALVSNFGHVLVFPRFLKFEDADYFSRHLGEITASEATTGHTRRGWLDISSSDTLREVARPLLSVAEMQRWPAGEGVLWAPGVPAARVLLPRPDQPRLGRVRNPLYEGYRRGATGADLRRLVFELVRRRTGVGPERPAGATGGNREPLPTRRPEPLALEAVAAVATPAPAAQPSHTLSPPPAERLTDAVAPRPSPVAPAPVAEPPLAGARDAKDDLLEGPARAIMALAFEQCGVTAAECIARLRMPKATVWRHLKELERTGLLRRVDDGGKQHSFAPVQGASLWPALALAPVEPAPDPQHLEGAEASTEPTDTPLTIPEALRPWRQWVVWRLDPAPEGGPKLAKVPYSPVTGRRASATDPGTWGSLEEAEAALAGGGYEGLGFVFTPEAGVVGVDLDGCLDPATGELEPWAAEVVRRLESYAERSPSGRGVHVLARGRLPEGRRRHGRVEMYDGKRYFTFTGERLPGAPAEVEAREAALAELHRELLGEASSRPAAPARSPLPVPGEDDAALLERARAARNGAGFAALYDRGLHDGPSASEADLALCSHLAYWTSGDAARVDQLFRGSALMRDKWDERRGDRTYGQLTVERAVFGERAGRGEAREEGG